MDTQDTTTTTEDQVTDQTDEQTQDEQSDESPAYTQSQLDAAISKAIRTREQKLRAEFEAQRQRELTEAETKALAEKQNYKKLWERTQAEKAALELQQQTTNVLAERKLSAFAPLFGHDLSSIDGRTAAADQLSEIVDQLVEERIKSRIQTPPPPKGDTKPNVDKNIADMTTEEYKQWREQQRIR